jgi:hypothetical protein
VTAPYCSVVNGGALSSVATIACPKARLVTAWVDVNPLVFTSLFTGRKSPVKLGLGQVDFTSHVVSPPRGTIVSDLLPRIA